MTEFDRFEILAGCYWYALQWRGSRKADRIAARLDRLAYKPGKSVQDGRIGQRAYATYTALAGKPDGYTHCACRDCFETTIGGSFCASCVDAGCELNSRCSVEGSDAQRCPDCGGLDGCYRSCPSQL